VRSAAEGDLHALVKRERLPEPMYNARLFVGNQLLAVPDAWWPQAGLAVEVDSREWHLSPADWERTLARDANLTEHGILTMRFTPRQIRTVGRDVASKIRTVLSSPDVRPLPRVTARPA
jgi:very-short-patch-repair endonuclease